MHTLLAVTAIVAAAPFIEPWGLSLEAKDGVVKIAAVRPDSTAARNKLEPGMRLLRVLSTAPKPNPVAGTLEAEDLNDVVAALREPGLTAVIIEIPASGSSEGYRRLDTEKPFVFKKADELKKMNPNEMAVYYGQLSVATAPRWSPSRVPVVRFDGDRLTRELVLDEKTKQPVGMTNGSVTGDAVYAQERLHFRCDNSPAVEAKLSGPSFAQPVVVDLRPMKIHGASTEVSFPLARLSQVTSCPSTPLVVPISLELKCEQGEPTRGRERIRLTVKCGKGEGFVMPLFSSRPPTVMNALVPVGTSHFQVRAPFDRSGNTPVELGVVIIDAAQKEVVRANALWKGDGKSGTDDWPEMKVPVPKAAGTYSLRYEGRFADGSPARSVPAQVTVQSPADEKAMHDQIQKNWDAMEALKKRMEQAGVDLCNVKVATKWLKRQPEVESVWDGDGEGYSYILKTAPTPHMVHCH
jgi:hypothetical protein